MMICLFGCTRRREREGQAKLKAEWSDGREDACIADGGAGGRYSGWGFPVGGEGRKLLKVGIVVWYGVLGEGH